MNEDDVLERFWSAANAGAVSRLELLREYAALVIGPGDHAAVRESSKAAQAHQRARKCFACGWTRREVRLIWHHVIQVQHGGSASLRNHVRLCEDCHAMVHPWLKRPVCKGWVTTFNNDARRARGAPLLSE